MWSPQQDAALVSVAEWLKSRGSDRPVYRMFGYAGTGKTTLAMHLAEGVDGRVRYAACTGKAASVMRQAGCEGAQTLHSLIYQPKPKSEARKRELLVELQAAVDREASDVEVRDLERQLKAEVANLKRPAFSLNLDSDLAEASLLVLDECSMVDKQMAEDILSFGVPVLALGDPAQLPPVGGGGWFTEATPDTMLTEIHRQALDNPIVALASKVRAGERLAPGKYGDSSVQARATPEEVLAADQVLVGKNFTRQVSNARVRQLKGFESPWPITGEKLVCLRNDAKASLLNGTLHVTTEDARDAGEFLSLTVAPEEGGEDQSVLAHRSHFMGSADALSNGWDKLRAQEFTYGYALTVHKAQGSQWPRVVLFDEWTQRDTRTRWLYTAITRAAERVTVVGSN